MASLTIDALLELWLADLRANDLAPGTVRRYKGAIESFLAWYDKEEQRGLTLEQLSPITLIGYRNFLQRTQQRATSTVNGHISALRAWCAWLTVERYLETNPAKRIKLREKGCLPPRSTPSCARYSLLAMPCGTTLSCRFSCRPGCAWTSVVNSRWQTLSLVSAAGAPLSDLARVIRLARSRSMPRPGQRLPNPSRLVLAAIRQSKPLPRLGHDCRRRSDRLLYGAARRVGPSLRRPCARCWMSSCVVRRLAGWCQPTRARIHCDIPSRVIT